MMGTFDIYDQAYELIKEKRPEIGEAKKAIFVNCVGYLVTGASGGIGGPSVREHAVGYLYHVGSYSFEQAVEICLADDGPVFGPLQRIHHQIWQNEHCFDDDIEDVKKLGLRG
jgi:hypothetical protein